MSDRDSIEYQIGASGVDTTPIDDSGEHVQFKTESSAVFKRLAEDIYSSPESGIREALTNAVTATLEATEDYTLERSDAVVRFGVDKDGDRVRLVIEDNGVGMTMERIRKVVSYVGRSTVRDDYDKAGQFGMGFLALFSLCGTDGGFMMHTNSRKSNTDPVSGVWKNGSFTRIDTREYAQNMKGTRFEMFLKNDISVSDLRMWVERNAQWSRVPVMYEESADESSWSEEYGSTKIKQEVDSDLVSTESTEFFDVAASSDLDESTGILLDVPVDINRNVKTPWNYIIRLHTEHPVVISGENKGDMVVDDAIYETLSDNRKKSYVPRTDVGDDEIVSPSPVGNREKLSGTDKFWSYVERMVRDSILGSIQTWIEELCHSESSSITDRQYSIIQDHIPQEMSSYDRFNTVCTNIFDSISDRESLYLYALQQPIKVVRNGRKSLDVYDVIKQDPDFVFMTTGHINEHKKRIVTESERESRIVVVDRSSWYQFYEDVFENWQPLSDVSEDHPVAAESDLEDIAREQSEDTVEQEETSLRFRSSQSATITVDKIQDSVENKNGYVIQHQRLGCIRKLLVFDDSSQHKISKNKWVSSVDGLGLVRATDSETVSKLMSIPVSVRFDDYVSDAKQQTVLTSDGYTDCEDINFESSLVQVISEDMRENILCTPEDCDRIRRLMLDGSFYKSDSIDYETHILVTMEEFKSIAPLVFDSTIMATDVNVDISTSLDGPTKFQCEFMLNNFEKRDNPIVQELDKRVLSKYQNKNQEVESILNLFETISSEDIDLNEVVSDV